MVQERDIAVASSPSATEVAREENAITLTQFAFLKFVRQKPMPIYPPELLSSGLKGKVVADVVADTTGHIKSVHSVEASHASFASAVEVAVMDWVIKPVGTRKSPDPNFVRTTLAFYFEVHDGLGQVRQLD